MLKRAISLVFLATQAHALAAGPRWTPRAKGDAPKFAAPVDEFVERIESAKTAVVGGLAASVAGAPLGLLAHLDNIGQWEFDTDQLSLMGALFGLVRGPASSQTSAFMWGV